jgi:hypothetical protein
MDLDPIEHNIQVTKDTSKYHANLRRTKLTRRKNSFKPKSASSHGLPSMKTSKSGIKKRPSEQRSSEPTDYSRAALECELVGLREEEREYRERLEWKQSLKSETMEEKPNEDRRPRRKITKQIFSMKSNVDDLSSRLGALKMGKEQEKQEKQE